MDFASRYTGKYSPINNYAANSYDAARLLLATIETAAKGDNKAAVIFVNVVDG
jgi:ABC-type branched-subunit amino acid transport system substrate-binding protein